MCCCVLYVCMCQPPAPPMTCGRKSSFAVLAGTQTCTANSSEKAGLSPAHSHPGAQNIGPSGLDRGAAAVRSCPRAARRLSARWLSLVRRRVVSESVLVHTHTSSRRSPASVCCLVCGAKIAEARTRRAAPRWRIDPGRSDLCSERQHGRPAGFRWHFPHCCRSVRQRRHRDGKRAFSATGDRRLEWMAGADAVWWHITRSCPPSYRSS